MAFWKSEIGKVRKTRREEGKSKKGRKERQSEEERGPNVNKMIVKAGWGISKANTEERILKGEPGLRKNTSIQTQIRKGKRKKAFLNSFFRVIITIVLLLYVHFYLDKCTLHFINVWSSYYCWTYWMSSKAHLLNVLWKCCSDAECHKRQVLTITLVSFTSSCEASRKLSSAFSSNVMLLFTRLSVILSRILNELNKGTPLETPDYYVWCNRNLFKFIILLFSFLFNIKTWLSKGDDMTSPI